MILYHIVINSHYNILYYINVFIKLQYNVLYYSYVNTMYTFYDMDRHLRWSNNASYEGALSFHTNRISGCLSAQDFTSFHDGPLKYPMPLISSILIYCIVRHYTSLYCTTMYCTTCTVLQCIVLYYILLWCIVLYYTVLRKAGGPLGPPYWGSSAPS